MPADGHARARAALAELAPVEQAPEALALADHFAAELDGYAELICARGQFGFMTRGRDAPFSERASGALARLGMPPEALAHHRALAAAFDHRNGFLKAEWSAAGANAACYFRRRPQVADVLGWLARWGVAAPVRAVVLELARALRKSTVHFVAAAFRAGQPLVHKLYFSQGVTPRTHAAVAEQLAAGFRLLGFPDATIAAWRARHDDALRGAETTVFASLSFTAGALAPSLKLDYSDLPVEVAAAFADAAERPHVLAESAALCRLAGTGRPSYVGLRFTPSSPTATVKLYSDVR